MIFQTYNVYYYDSFITSWPNTIYYRLACDCNAAALEIALDDYNNVISSSRQFAAAFLSNTEFSVNQFVIFPNPVSNYLHFNLNSDIKKVAVFNILGERVSYLEDLNLRGINTENLATGTYVIEVVDDAGNRFVQKFLKQ